MVSSSSWLFAPTLMNAERFLDTSIMAQNIPIYVSPLVSHVAKLCAVEAVALKSRHQSRCHHGSNALDFIFVACAPFVELVYITKWDFINARC